MPWPTRSRCIPRCLPPISPIMRSRWGALITALLALVANAAPAAGRRPSEAQLRGLEEGRALWVKRDQLMSRERIIRLVDDSSRSGYTLLFVQVRGRGDAWYDSDLIPRATQLAALKNEDGTPFDPLEFLLRRAHARGLQVHAWFNSFLVWSNDFDPSSPRHVLNAHPDWVAVDATGRSLADYATTEYAPARIEGVFLSPGIPAVRAHLVEAVRELAERYPLDGIHLDYTRWVLVDTGYDAKTRAAFMAEEGFDPLDLRGDSARLKARFGPLAVKSLEERWRSWKADQVTHYVADLRAMLDAQARPLVFSAAVFPNVAYAPNDVLQDWGAWSKHHLVDLLVPMFYSPSTTTVLKQLEMAQAVVPPDVLIYAGLAVWNQPLDSAAEKARACRRAGVQGVCFFPYDTLAETPGALTTLTRAAFGAIPPTTAFAEDPAAAR